jgi:hypothetical protein
MIFNERFQRAESNMSVFRRSAKNRLINFGSGRGGDATLTFGASEHTHKFGNACDMVQSKVISDRVLPSSGSQDLPPNAFFRITPP